MHNVQVKTVIYFLCCLLILSACTSNNGDIKLCDYKHIPIPDEEKTVSDEDIAASISIDLYMKEVVIPKEQNKNIVEADDVISISVSVNNQAPKNQIITVGDEEYGKEFDEQILGKRLYDKIEFDTTDSHFVVEINSIMVYATAITDEIARDFFGRDSSEQVIEDTRNEIMKLRVSEYMYAYLINNSMLRDFYQEREEYATAVMNRILRSAIENGYDVSQDDFWESEYGISAMDFRHEMESSYDEYLILCEFMHQEQSEITDDELYTYLQIDTSVMDGNEEDIFGVFGKEYALYTIYHDKCLKLLLTYAKL